MRLVALVAAVAAVVGLVGGCKKDSASSASGSGSSAAAVAVAGVPGSCNDAINHSVDTMIAKKKEEAGGSGFGSDRQARLEKLRVALGNRCSEDKWSPAMLACVSAVTQQHELMQCMSANLDKEQSSRAMGEIATAMMGGRGFGGPNGMGMHPGTDLDGAYQKRIAALADRLTAATTALATATADGKAAAQAEVDRLTREKDTLEKSFAQMKAMHPGPLQGNAGVGSATMSPGSGSAGLGSATMSPGSAK